MLSPPVSEIRLGAPANPLAFTSHFYSAGSQTQHRFFLLSKMNLSPSQKCRETAADIGYRINVIVQQPMRNLG